VARAIMLGEYSISIVDTISLDLEYFPLGAVTCKAKNTTLVYNLHRLLEMLVEQQVQTARKSGRKNFESNQIKYIITKPVSFTRYLESCSSVTAKTSSRFMNSGCVV